MARWRRTLRVSVSCSLTITMSRSWLRRQAREFRRTCHLRMPPGYTYCHMHGLAWVHMSGHSHRNIYRQVLQGSDGGNVRANASSDTHNKLSGWEESNDNGDGNVDKVIMEPVGVMDIAESDMSAVVQGLSSLVEGNAHVCDHVKRHCAWLHVCPYTWISPCRSTGSCK